MTIEEILVISMCASYGAPVLSVGFARFKGKTPRMSPVWRYFWESIK